MINDAPLPAKIVAYFRDKANAAAQSPNTEIIISQAELVTSLWRQGVGSNGVIDDHIRNSLHVNVCWSKCLLSPWESLVGQKWRANYLYRQRVPLLYPCESYTQTLWASVVTILQTCSETEAIAGILEPWKSQINTNVRAEDAMGVLSQVNIVVDKSELTDRGLYLIHHLDKKAAWLLVWNGLILDPLQTYKDLSTLDVLSVYHIRSVRPKKEKEKPKQGLMYYGRDVGYLPA